MPVNMKKLIVSFAIITALIIGCKTNNKSNDAKTLTVALEPKSNSKVAGTATFVEKNGKVTFTAKITGLEPGVHAIHIH